MQNTLNNNRISSHRSVLILILSIFATCFPCLAETLKQKPLPVDLNQPAEKPQKLQDNAIKPAELEKDRLFRKDTILRINEILKQVQQNYPSLAEKFSDEKQEKIIKSLVACLDSGMEYIPAAEREKNNIKPKNDGNMEIFPAIIVAKHKVLYIRMDSFTEDTVKQLQTDAVSSYRLANPPDGIILDLRNAQGDNIIEALKALGLFIEADKIPLPDKIKPLKKVLNTPVLILIGKETKGAPEIFALMMAKLESGMLLGEKTRGAPFNKKEVPLNNGDYLMVPLVPEYLTSLNPAAAVPAINFNAGPQLDFKKLREEAGSEISDKALQRAIDLIVCLKALSTEKK